MSFLCTISKIREPFYSGSCLAPSKSQVSGLTEGLQSKGDQQKIVAFGLHYIQDR